MLLGLLLGLLLVPDTILRSLALGAIIVGIVTMAAAITLLPALLSLLGDRVNALRLPVVGRDHPAESPFWTKAVGAVVRRQGRRGRGADRAPQGAGRLKDGRPVRPPVPSRSRRLPRRDP